MVFEKDDRADRSRVGRPVVGRGWTRRIRLRRIIGYARSALRSNTVDLAADLRLRPDHWLLLGFTIVGDDAGHHPGRLPHSSVFRRVHARPWEGAGPGRLGAAGWNRAGGRLGARGAGE